MVNVTVAVLPSVRPAPVAVTVYEVCVNSAVGVPVIALTGVENEAGVSG